MEGVYLSGLHDIKADSIRGNQLTINGTSTLNALTAHSLSGCVSDSSTTSNGTLAASLTALSNVTSALATTTSNVSNVNIVANAALPKTGGIVTGDLTIKGTFYASNVSVLGTTEIVNAYETHSSNVVISNSNTGPEQHRVSAPILAGPENQKNVGPTFGPHLSRS